LAVLARLQQVLLLASPARLQDVEDRLALLERLKRKYGPTLDEVIARAQALARERELLTGEGARLEDLQAALTDAGGRYLIAARELSERRRIGPPLGARRRQDAGAAQRQQARKLTPGQSRPIDRL